MVLENKSYTVDKSAFEIKKIEKSNVDTIAKNNLFLFKYNASFDIKKILTIKIETM
ncbi:hypothetical protein NUITMVS1_13850 [Shewanella xiamenensis]|nr:hypothetical protein NUITMVS1_13850 [Shewanella xiamenensis]